MYARVAAFENRDLSLIDELIGIVRERAGSARELPEATRFLMLVDREGGTSLGITLFESEEAIRRAEPVFEKMGDEIPEQMRGRRTSVGVYEVVLEDVAEGAKAARVSSFEGPPEGIDDGIRFIRERILPEAGGIPGWRGVVSLADRASGRTKTITFWDSAESLQASEARADELRGEAAEAMGESIAGVDRYEVAVHEVPAAASR
jgi:heme-degrading monooxygenase HmoA